VTAPSPTPKPGWRRGTALAWVILKNLFGWIFILASWPVGLLVPGPAGLPLFILGFALISLPGKRRLTARVLRGRQFNLSSKGAILGSLIACIVLPPLVSWRLHAIHSYLADKSLLRWSQRFGVYVIIVLATFVLAQLAMRGANIAVSWMPWLRRKSRPWLRKRGFDLLPPRRRRRHRARSGNPDDQILEIHPRLTKPFRNFWRNVRPGGRRSTLR
jgi:hypothetical protein